MDKKFQETLVSYAGRIDSAREELVDAMKKFITMAFDMHEEWKVPDCLVQCILSECDAAPDADIVDFKHYSAYVTPMAVRRKMGASGMYQYYVDGQEWGDGYTEYHAGLHVVDYNILFNFLSWYVYHFSDYLEDLKQRISGCTRVGDIGIVVEEWCEENCYDFDSIDIEAVMAWSNEWINENK